MAKNVNKAWSHSNSRAWLCVKGLELGIPISHVVEDLLAVMRHRHETARQHLPRKVKYCSALEIQEFILRAKSQGGRLECTGVDSEDEPADPNIIYEEPDDKASSSDKDVSDATLPARRTFSIVIFLEHYNLQLKWSLMKSLLVLFLLCAMREHLDPRRQSLGCSLTQLGNGPEGTIEWGISASHCKAHFSLWVIRRAILSDQGLGHNGPGTIQVRRTLEVTTMSKNLTHGPKRQANTRTKGFLSPQSRCSLHRTNRSICDVDHIGWGYSPRADLEARVRALDGASGLGSGEGAGGGVSSSTEPSLPAAEEELGDRSEIKRALDKL
ncbi:hypothetical protein BC332_29191 [Capsicum chinense]|nr:hypothetical protein BC332_29191 [Capsicum chinense]